MGPLANPRRIEALEALIADAQGLGARLVTGGKRPARPGYFFEPTVLADTPQSAKVMTEEPFGPLTPFAPFDDEAEAVARANATPYGLSAYAFTGSAARRARLAMALDAGLVGLNSFQVAAPDVPFGGDPVTADLSEEETDYLLAAVNRYFRQPVGRGDIVASYSGVRPLYDDLSREDVSTVTRDYAFDIDAEGGGAPLLSVYGGKLTTYRKLAEHALEELAPSLGDVGRPWTAGASLPGGEIAYEGWDGFRAEMGRRYPFLPQGTAERLIACYGTRLPRVLGDASSMDDLGPMLLGDLSAREADYLRREEFARTEEDMLFRRTKVGLRLEEAARHTMAGPRRDSAREAR